MPAMMHTAANTTARACQVRSSGMAKEAVAVMSEEAHLLADLFRLHRMLTDEALEIARGRRAVAGKVIVDVPVDIEPLLRQCHQHRGPRLQLARTIDLDAR